GSLSYDSASGGKVATGSFNVINSDITEGDMTAISQSPYVTVTSEKVFKIPPGGSYPVTYEVRLPDDFPPGQTRLLVTATKAPDNGATFGIAVALNYVIFVDKPYPDAYVDASVSGVKVVNNTVSLTVTGANKGSLPITGAKAYATVFDNSGAVVDNLQSDSGEIPLATSTDFNMAWNAPKTGSYPIEAWISWGTNNSSVAKSVIRVGEESLDIASPPTQILGGSIQPYKIPIESTWNEPISANALLRIFGSDGKTTNVETIPSATVDVPGWGTKDFLVYVDTTSLSYGAYNAEIELSYNGKKVTKDFTLEVVSKITETPAGNATQPGQNSTQPGQNQSGAQPEQPSGGFDM
ncbi:MAG TPA: hypothetical protein PLO51_06100, partial [Candidatus Micrarchaeota archaeon]|nr:hypothetical protein [Candidatus Micrarchaeota archaeon]